MRGVTLLAWRSAIRFEDGLDEWNHRSYHRSRSFDRLALGRVSAREHLPHHPPSEKGSWDGRCVRPVCRIATNQVLLQVFSMRSMASGAAFHRTYHRATQQEFLDAHEHAL